MSEEKTPKENEERSEQEEKDDVEAHKHVSRPHLEAEEPDVEGHKLRVDRPHL